MKNRASRIKAIIIITCFLVGAALLVGVFGLIEALLDKTGSDKPVSDEFSYAENSAGQIYYESNWYVPDDSKESILILGIDQKEDSSEKRQNSQQADFFALVVMDKKEESYRILYLNRDTITDIPQTDAFGKIYGYTENHLSLAHTYGDNDKMRCRNTVNAAEHLPYGIDIDHYLSLTMDAVAILNDSVGGVTVQLMDDFTMLDETFIKDSTVTLRGDQALSYVQDRGSLEDSSNLHRMERQQQYITALLDRLGTFELENNSDTLIEVSEYLVSDCTIDQLSRWIKRLGSYEYKGSDSLPGEAIAGAEYMEYHVDEQALQELVIDLFYKLKD
jgi:LCP family protein required for cell wall assembly